MEQLEEKGILKHWQTDQGNNPYTDQWGQVHVPDPEKPHPADAKVVNMYIMENPHLMWEESRLLDVAMGKEDFIYWICRGSGDAEPFRLWNSNPGVIKYDPDSTHIRVYQSPASKIGRWCCCKDGHTGQTMGRRDLSNYIYRQEDILKPKKNKSRRNLMVEDFSLPQKKRKGRSNNASTIKKKKVSY